jgi:adenine phosphoribosyltransferase
MRDFAEYIRNIPDFPKPGIQFKDITPLLGDPQIFREAVQALAEPFKDRGVQYVASIDARGFIFGGAMAYMMGVGFVPIRKKGKLPYRTYEVSYDLEYGSNTLTIHQDAFPPGSKVLICDDVLATGGTALATAKLVEKVGGEVVGITFLAELTFLNGREKLKGYDVHSLIAF